MKSFEFEYFRLWMTISPINLIAQTPLEKVWENSIAQSFE
jgi:hypothetical protein